MVWSHNVHQARSRIPIARPHVMRIQPSHVRVVTIVVRHLFSCENCVLKRRIHHVLFVNVHPHGSRRGGLSRHERRKPPRAGVDRRREGGAGARRRRRRRQTEEASDGGGSTLVDAGRAKNSMLMYAASVNTPTMATQTTATSVAICIVGASFAAEKTAAARSSDPPLCFRCRSLST